MHKCGIQKTLDRLKPGQSGRVCRIEMEGVLKRKLLDMGLTPGVEIYVRKTAPLGDPMEICLRGYELTLRKKDAKKIHMEY